jgi:hypothetical protein
MEILGKSLQTQAKHLFRSSLATVGESQKKNPKKARNYRWPHTTLQTPQYADDSSHARVHNKSMATEKELLERIRQLEEQNSVLQDKLDMIYAILAPDFEEAVEEEGADEHEAARFVQIDGFNSQKKFD